MMTMSPARNTVFVTILLGAFAGGLLAMGVECVEDLHDVEPEDCVALGMSHIQQNRLRKELAKLAT